MAARLRCRLCDSDRLLSVLDLGATPLCEKYLTVDELDLPEPTFPLHLRLCEDCLLLQLPALITPADTFTEYPHFSSFSDSCVQRARDFVDRAVDQLELGPESLVIEVGSNDGYLLQYVVGAGVPCLGIEPSINVGAVARDRGVPTVSAFLDEQLARSVREEHGPADLVIANNVYANVPELPGLYPSAARIGQRRGLGHYRGTPCVELGGSRPVRHDRPRTLPVLHTPFGDARACHRRAGSRRRRTHSTQGGSIRIWARPARIAAPASERVVGLLRMENAAGLHRVDGYLQLRRRTESLRHNLLRFLLQCRGDGKRVVGYGAPAQGDTLSQLLWDPQRSA